MTSLPFRGIQALRTRQKSLLDKSRRLLAKKEKEKKMGERDGRPATESLYVRVIN